MKVVEAAVEVVEGAGAASRVGLRALVRARSPSVDEVVVKARAGGRAKRARGSLGRWMISCSNSECTCFLAPLHMSYTLYSILALLGVLGAFPA